MIEGTDLELFERGLRDATSRSSSESLDAALADLGWADALEVDARAAVGLLFEAQGAANATSSALERVLIAGMDLGGAAGPLGVVLPALGGEEPPGRLVEGRCVVQGLVLSGTSRRGALLVAVREDDRYAAHTLAPSDLRIRRAGGLDPALGLAEVSGEPAVEPEHGQGIDWELAVALGQRALGHQLVGAGRAMLELGRRHALDRVQFGRPIASFQAVRHRLSDSLVAVEAAEALLGAAWDDPSPLNTRIAKAFAGRAARLVARHCQQVLAGIGFTTEHPFHRYLRRSLALDQLLGASSRLTRQLGAEILGCRQLPPPIPL